MKTDPDEVYAAYFFFLFLQFDRDLNGLDLEEFKSTTKRIMLAVANWLRLSPFQMILEDDGFLTKVVEWESTKLLP